MTISEPIDHDDLNDAGFDQERALGYIDDEETQSWDSFWSEIQAEEATERGEQATEVIRGVTVAIPHDLPLRFDRRLEQLSGSSTGESVKTLVADLFGDDVLEQWINAGMTQLEFRVVLMWGIAHGRGKPFSFREAYDIVREQNQGKAKPDSTPTSSKSAGSGGRSKRTSAANTGSRQARSRT
ncbi:hypothetical protein [Streptosporangium sp. NPDC006930]|uniref:hypothetical protein n=1 Tax=Streptosporangium sp. NPDC006930 TaxID=3154783 RepID=UPI00342477C2